MVSITSQRPKPRTTRNNTETRDILTRNARRLRLYRGLLATVPTDLLGFMSRSGCYHGYVFCERMITEKGILPPHMLRWFLQDLRRAGFVHPPEDPLSWFYTDRAIRET